MSSSVYFDHLEFLQILQTTIADYLQKQLYPNSSSANNWRARKLLEISKRLQAHDAELVKKHEAKVPFTPLEMTKSHELESEVQNVMSKYPSMTLEDVLKLVNQKQTHITQLMEDYNQKSDEPHQEAIRKLVEIHAYLETRKTSLTELSQEGYSLSLENLGHNGYDVELRDVKKITSSLT